MKVLYTYAVSICYIPDAVLRTAQLGHRPKTQRQSACEGACDVIRDVKARLVRRPWRG